MKNISRRVFIKGMAVAAAATAASTVLAGCNFVPGTEEPEVVPTPSNSLTYKDGDKTLSITAPKFEIDSYGATSAGKEVVLFNIVTKHDLGQDVKFVNSAAADDKKYIVEVTAKAWDEDGASMTVPAFSATDYKNHTNLFNGSNNVVSKNLTVDGVIGVEMPDTWAKIVLTLKVFKPVTDAAGGNPTLDPVEDTKVEFTFNK